MHREPQGPVSYRSTMTSSSLEVPRRQRPERRSKWWRLLVVLATLALAAGWLVWYLLTPEDLPTSEEVVEGSAVVDQVVYVGMFAPGSDFDRSLEISEISVDVSPADVADVTPMICRDGSLAVTADVDTFCPELDPPEDADFSDGDSIVLAVSSSLPTEIEIGRIEISFRDGIRWGTKEAGIAGATVSFLFHTPNPVEEDTGSESRDSDRPGEDEGSDREKRGDKGTRDDQGQRDEGGSA